MHVERLETFADNPQRAVQTIVIGGSIVLHQVQKVELYGSNLAQEFSSAGYFFNKSNAWWFNQNGKPCCDRNIDGFATSS